MKDPVYPGYGLTYYDLQLGDELAIRVGWDDGLGRHEWIKTFVVKVTKTQAVVVLRHPLLGTVMEMRYLRRVVVGSRIPFWPDVMNWAGAATYLLSEKTERMVDNYALAKLCAKLGVVHPEEGDGLTDLFIEGDFVKYK